MSADSDFDTVVIGAGLVGAACALRLAAGGRQVLLLDAQAPGQGASFGNAGHVATEQVFPLASPELIRASWRYLFAADSPLHLRQPYLLPLLPWMARFVWAARPAAFARGVAGLLALQRTALTDLSELMRHAGIGDQLHADGYLRVWESVAGEQAAKGDAARLQPYGIDTEPVGEDFLRRMAPDLAPGVRGGVFYPGTAHVDDPLAVSRGLVDALLRRGGQLRQQRVLAIRPERDGALRLELAQGGALRCRQVLVCAGAWSRPLAASLGYRVPLDTERGYHITVPWSGHAGKGAARGAVLMPVASTERKVIMTPMSMGLRMTGTLEFGGLRLPADVRRYALLRRQLQALVPAVDSTDATTWMGFRPSLPDHLPVLGRAPRHSNVFFAFGHQHLGLTLCGVTARVMSELMLEGAASFDFAPYRVDRF